MCLDSTPGDRQARRDRIVRMAADYELEDFALAARQGSERSSGGRCKLALDRCERDTRREISSASHDRADGIDDFRFGLRLEREPICASKKHIGDKCCLGDAREAKNAAARLKLAKFAGKRDPRFHRHQNIDDRDIELNAPSDHDGLGRVVGLGDNFKLRLSAQSDRQARTKKRVIIDD